MYKLLMIFFRYYHTLKHLTFIQIKYQIWYRIRKNFRKIIGFKYQLNIDVESYGLDLDSCIIKPKSFYYDKKFIFLNQTIDFEKSKIDWNFDGFGKLWTYNLNYMDFLLQKGLDKKSGVNLIKTFINDLQSNKVGKEPYTLSLRCVNWIKFVTLNQVQDSEIDSSLFAQYKILLDNLEYQILGNHLLEDAYSLLFGAFYFKNNVWYLKASEILRKELIEQYDDDGGHFEKSPMYHLILLEKNLDALNLIKNNNWKSDLYEIFKSTACNSLAFMDFITVNNHFPQFNDAAFGIAPKANELRQYAINLDLNWKPILQGKQSGFRRWQMGDLIIFMDTGSIGPNYQPGHAHADTFTFCLYYKDIPIIVDTGTSTYNIGETRTKERSTLMHNTVAYNYENSSEVWSGFRVAKRAEIVKIEETKNVINVIHNGYKKYGIQHNRKLNFESKTVKVIDKLIGKINYESMSSLHFHPDVKLSLKENILFVNNDLKISFKGFEKIKIINYDYAEGFNKLKTSKKTQGFFKEESQFIIERIDN